MLIFSVNRIFNVVLKCHHYVFLLDVLKIVYIKRFSNFRTLHKKIRYFLTFITVDLNVLNMIINDKKGLWKCKPQH